MTTTNHDATAQQLQAAALYALNDAKAARTKATDDDGFYVDDITYALQQAQVYATLAVAAATVDVAAATRSAGGWVSGSLDKLPVGGG